MSFSTLSSVFRFRAPSVSWISRATDGPHIQIYGRISTRAMSSSRTSELPKSSIPIFTTLAAYRAWRKEAFQANKTVGYVPTMGALHEGHLSLGTCQVASHAISLAAHTNDVRVQLDDLSQRTTSQSSPSSSTQPNSPHTKTSRHIHGP